MGERAGMRARVLKGVTDVIPFCAELLLLSREEQMNDRIASG